MTATLMNCEEKNRQDSCSIDVLQQRSSQDAPEQCCLRGQCGVRCVSAVYGAPLVASHQLSQHHVGNHVQRTHMLGIEPL